MIKSCRFNRPVAEGIAEGIAVHVPSVDRSSWDGKAPLATAAGDNCHEDAPWQAGANAGAVPATDSVYVDDDTFFIAHSSALEVLRRADRTLVIVVEEMTALGLEVNLSAGKTEALVHLVGPVSRKVVKDRRADHSSRAFCIGVGDVFCGVVRQYKHMGTIRDAQGHGELDARARSRATLQAYAPHAHRFF